MGKLSFLNRSLVERAIKAVKQIQDRDGVPLSRRSTKYELVFEGQSFPPKFVIQQAAELAGINYDELNLHGGDETNGPLTSLGFMIINKESNARSMSEQNNQTDHVQNLEPTNLIMYGPPGTGKTYKSALEAVKLCDGNAPLERGELMRRYRELLDEKRISFVTFHQSYSYEDFVEGLRPVTNSEINGSEQSTISGGFSLQPQDGVFKQIADLARANHGRPTVEPVDLIDENQKFFKMSLGPSADDEGVYQEAIRGEFVALGHGGEFEHWSDSRFDTKSAIENQWIESHPEAKKSDPNIILFSRFRVDMDLGSLVIITDGNRKFRAIGRISSGYYFEPSQQYKHRRKVEWLWHSEESLPYDVVYGRQFSQVSIYRLDSSQVFWKALRQLVVSGGLLAPTEGGAEPHVLIIDEINRANVSKVFGELITLIEPDKRSGCDNALSVILPYSRTAFSVPRNLHIIGTMNTADRSVSLLDTALRRRFKFMELMPDAALLKVVDGIDLAAMLSALNLRIEYLFDRDHQIGHAFFMKCETQGDIELVMRDSVIPLLVEYFYEDWEKVRQVLNESKDDGYFILRKKIATPRGSDLDGHDVDRWRYTLQSHFSNEAFIQLCQ